MQICDIHVASKGLLNMFLLLLMITVMAKCLSTKMS